MADEGVDFGRGALVFAGKLGLDGCLARMGHNLRNSFGGGELLGQLHNQAGNGDTAGGAEELGLVRVLDAYGRGASDDILRVRLGIVALQGGQMGLEVAHLVLQVDDVVARYLAALGRVVILAVRVGALAGPAARQTGVASRLALFTC